jgi:hypothetical protein
MRVCRRERDRQTDREGGGEGVDEKKKVPKLGYSIDIYFCLNAIILNKTNVRCWCPFLSTG